VVINPKVYNKFCGYLAQVETKNPSGATEQDKVKMNCYQLSKLTLFRLKILIFFFLFFFQIYLAKDMYQNEYSIGFQFEHCWNLLKMLPKWKQLKPVLRRKSIGISPSPQLVIHLGEDNDDENVIVDFERPIGKKAAKEREKKKEQRLWRERDCDGGFD
jgi:hypothetical protein